MNHLRIRRSGVRISPGALDMSLAIAGDMLVLLTSQPLGPTPTWRMTATARRAAAAIPWRR